MSRPLALRSLASITCAGAILAFAVACRDAAPSAVPGTDTGPLVAATDSVHIVEDTAPRWGSVSQWTVGDSPTLDLGDPAQPFLGVATVLRLSDGRIVVADGSRQDIRFFDKTGKLLTTVGGRGIDEGEFHGLGWIGRGAADAVVAYDFVARRLTLFDAKGKFVQVAALQPADPTVALEPLATFPDGSVLFRAGGVTRPFPGAVGTVRRDSASYLRFGLDGAPTAAFGRFPSGESFGVQVRKGDSVAPFPVPFGLTTSATLRSDTMLIGTGASFEIASIGPDGETVGLLRASIPRADVTREEAKAFTDAALTRIRSGIQSMRAPLDSSFIRAIEKAPFPAQMPAFGRILVDRTGALWVSAPLVPPAVPTSWNVFAPDGSWLGAVTTPAGFRVDEIGTDYLLGVWRQVHGQERVRSYPLSRGASS